MFITDIKSHKILDSAGNWTIETSITLDDGSVGTASIPGGVSKGSNEVATLDPIEALKAIEELKEDLKQREFDSQTSFDIKLIELDATSKKTKLGGNTILSLSIAYCKACAKSKNLELFEYIHTLINPEISLDLVNFKLPQMYMLLMEGGLHGSNDASIQEFMVIVRDIEKGLEIYKNIKSELHKQNKSTNVGLEGAFSPEGFDNEQSLELISRFSNNEKLALDVAASSIQHKDHLPDYEHLLKNFNIASIEDPYAENDWAQWEYFASKHLKEIRIVTDDLTTTNPSLLRKAIERRVGNAIIIKPNQIGTVYETLKVIKMAQENNWDTIISHRSTDTNDSFIADLAVGVGSPFVKFGSPVRGERTAKYNRLQEIGQLLILP